MTRKDYVKFSELIRRAKLRETLPEEFPPVMEFIEAEISNIFAEDNPRFDAERFARACEYEEPEPVVVHYHAMQDGKGGQVYDGPASKCFLCREGK